MTASAFQGTLSAREERQSRSGADAVTWLTIYLIALLAVPSRLVVGPLGSAGAPSMLIGLVSMALWLMLALMRRESVARPNFYPLRWALAALLIVSGISYTLAMSRPINGDEVSPADVSILALLSWTGTLLIAADAIGTRSRIDTFVWRIAIAGGLLALVGLAQFFTVTSYTDLITIPGLKEVSSSGLYFRNGLVRPNATATHPIEYGALMAMMLPLAVHVAVHHTARRLFIRWAPVAAIVAVIAISGSRSAYLCALAGILVCVFAWTPRLRRWVFAISVVGIGLVIVLVPRMARIIIGLFDDPKNDPSITSRTDSFDLAWLFIRDYPLFGRGFGTFLPKYRIFDNQYLVQLVSVGVLGTVALVALGLVAIAEMRRVARAVEGAEAIRTRDLAAALSGAIVAGFVSMAFFDAFAFPMTMGLLFLLLGVAGALARLSRDSAQSWRG